MCGAAGSPRTGLRRVGRGGQDPSELASRCAAATGLSCRASRCMSGSASVPAAQLPTAASRCATLQALHTPVHQMWGGAARTPARASTVVDNTCPQKGKMFFSVCGRTPPVEVLSNRLGPRAFACQPLLTPSALFDWYPRAQKPQNSAELGISELNSAQLEICLHIATPNKDMSRQYGVFWPYGANFG